MLELTGATLVPGTVDVGAPASPSRIVALRDARVSGLLGADVPRERSAEILTALGFTVTEATTGSASACRTGAAPTSRARPT